MTIFIKTHFYKLRRTHRRAVVAVVVAVAAVAAVVVAVVAAVAVVTATARAWAWCEGRRVSVLIHSFLEIYIYT